MEKTCIYCGAKEDLSNSDIIPDALTNAKIINPNVCRIKHNNKFSDLFEDEVIKELALITNELDIKSSKGKKYAPYDAKIIVDGTEYSTKISSDIELFNGKKIISTEDGKSKLGPIDQISKIKNANDENITVIDVNQLEIEKRIVLNPEIFFSLAMHRLMAKIAFEWYCLHNEVQGKIEAFDDIIEFITSGHGKNPVKFVSNKDIYRLINNQTEFGSHVLLSYIAEDNSVNVIVSLFGIAIYNIHVLDEKIEQCKNNAIFQEVTIDAKREKLCFQSLEELSYYFNNSFYKYVLPDGRKVMMPRDKKDTSLRYQLMYITYYEMFQKGLMCIDEANYSAIKLLKTQIESILQSSALTIRGLKRFVKEHKDYLNKENALNPKGTNKESIFLFYMLFIIGKSKGKIQNLHDLNMYIKQRFLCDSIIISDEMSKNFQEEILKTDEYFEIIKLGALAVESWPF